MKIRNGFVSNSSSSSFVVLLPENFVENIDFNKITDEYEDFKLDDFKSFLNKVIEDSGIWKEEISEEYGYEFSDALDTLFRPYVVASIETSSDSGQIVILDREEIKKLL